METTEKIVEAYVRYVKGWATIANIRCKGQHEIDLFAIDPKNNERYHIEVSVSSSSSFSKLTDNPFDAVAYKIPTKKAIQRRTIGFFKEKKFSPENVRKKLEELGCPDGFAKPIIVTWDWTDEGRSAAENANIELWSFQEIMHEVADALRTSKSYFTDDTLRTIHLFVKALKARDKKTIMKPNKSHETKKPQLQNDSYWVYRNYIHQRARLHKAECSYCNFGQGTQNAPKSTSTGEWQNFTSKSEAMNFLKSLPYTNSKLCGHCL